MISFIYPLNKTHSLVLFLIFCFIQATSQAQTNSTNQDLTFPGVVISKTGTRIKDAQIIYRYSNENTDKETKSLPGGTFTLIKKSLNAKLQRLTIHHPEYETFEQKAPFPITNRYLFRMTSNNRYTLKIVDQISNTPVSNFIFLMYRFGEHSHYQVFNHPQNQGGFTKSVTTPHDLGALLPKNYYFSVMTTDQNGNPDGRGGYTYLELGPDTTGKEITVNVSPDFGSTVSGTISFSDNSNSFDKIEVTLEVDLFQYRPETENAITQQTTSVNKEGVFKFNHVLPGRYSLTSTGDWYQQKEKLSFVIKEEKEITDKDIHLYRSGRVQGKLIGPGGSPLSNIKLELKPSVKNAIGQSTITDQIGFFQFNSVPPGQVKITPKNGLAAHLIMDPIEILPQELNEITLDLSHTISFTPNVIIDGEKCIVKPSPYRKQRLNVYKEPSSDKEQQPIILPSGEYGLYYRDRSQRNVITPLKWIELSTDNLSPKFEINSFTVPIIFDLEENQKNLFVQYTLITEKKKSMPGLFQLMGKNNMFKVFLTGEYTFEIHSAGGLIPCEPVTIKPITIKALPQK
jgi:hypothetical protein